MTTSLIMLPGMSYNEKLWQYQIDNLSDIAKCQVVIPNKARLQEDVDKVLGATKGPIAVLGHSIGAWVAIATAGKAPERVTHLASIGGWARQQTDVVEFLRGAINTIKTDGLEVFKDNVRATAMGDHCQRNDEITALVKSMQKNVTAQELIAEAEAIIHDNDITACLPYITAKTLIIHNESDNFFSLEEARYLADTIKNAELAIIANASHLSPLEYPEEITRLLRDWLTR